MAYGIRKTEINRFAFPCEIWSDASQRRAKTHDKRSAASVNGEPLYEELQATYMSGPLTGLRIVELAGIGPAPFAAMVLADAGADIIRIDRPSDPDEQASDDNAVFKGRALNIMNRGRRSIIVDLKQSEGREFILALIERADGLIEGFRPGVTERLGLGPDACAAHNPRLVYGRATGWGRDGPYSQSAGHDINFISLSGSLSAIGPADGPPVAPLNLLGDFGGGGLLLAYGMTCALHNVTKTGIGQTVDVAMVDGAAYLATYIHGMRALGLWNDERSSNILDGGAPFYRIYATKDGQYLSVGAIEEQFFIELLEKVGLSEMNIPSPADPRNWREIYEALESRFLSRTLEEWELIFAGSNACVAPVLSMSEAPKHPHIIEQGTFIEVDGTMQPAPEPRFSRTPSSIQRPPPYPGQDGISALNDWGLSEDEVKELLVSGAINAEPSGP
jgi:alpha-methylacyl-CoA racemase